VVSTNKDEIDPIDRLKRKAYTGLLEGRHLSLILVCCMKEFVGNFGGVGFYQPTLSDSEAFRVTA
jgi:hypothetical protein